MNFEDYIFAMQWCQCEIDLKGNIFICNVQAHLYLNIGYVYLLESDFQHQTFHLRIFHGLPYLKMLLYKSCKHLFKATSIIFLFF